MSSVLHSSDFILIKCFIYQLQSFESIGNKSEHSISSSQKSNQSNSKGSYNSSSEKANTRNIIYDTNDNDMNHPSHYRINDISDNYNNNNSSSNNNINLNGNGIGNIGGSTSNNNSSHDECSINTNNNSSNHSSNSSIHRATDIRNSRNIVRSTNERDENNIIGNMKSGLRDDGSIAFTSIDISRSRFNNMTLHPTSSTSSPNPTTPS